MTAPADRQDGAAGSGRDRQLRPAGAERQHPLPAVAADRGGSGWRAARGLQLRPGRLQARGDAVNVYYRRSTDSGATWGTEVLLNDDGTTRDQFFPTLSVGASNVVSAAWYDRRHDPNNTLLRLLPAVLVRRRRDLAAERPPVGRVVPGRARPEPRDLLPRRLRHPDPRRRLRPLSLVRRPAGSTPDIVTEKRRSAPTS